MVLKEPFFYFFKLIDQEPIISHIDFDFFTIKRLHDNILVQEKPKEGKIGL